MSDVPPARQCTLPTCEREATDPTRPGSLCESHTPEPANTDESGLEDPETSDATPGVEADNPDSSAPGDDRPAYLECFAAAIEFCHDQLDAPLGDGSGRTAREYLREARGWSDATIDRVQAGYAPPGRYTLKDHLLAAGFEEDTLAATGLFWNNDHGLDPVWQGRIVLPYLVDGRPVYAISRRLEPAHEQDWAGKWDADDEPAKYHKVPNSRDGVAVEEPIYGLDSLEPGADVLITEGIADAITAHAAGYPCLSPVTVQFKTSERERLLDVLDAHDVGTVYVVQDAERPTSDLTADRDGWDALTVSQYGEGLKGAVKTAGYLEEHGVDARLAQLPRPGLDKVDLDDYLTDWSDALDPVLASAKPASAHPAHDPRDTTLQAAQQAREAVEARAGGSDSALFDLTLRDVSGLSEGFRGTNPLGHHGESENYFVVLDGGELAYDHKHKAAYNALTYILVEAGERHPDAPNGRVDDAELFAAWRHAKAERYLAPEDPIPHSALRHVALSNGLCDPDDVEDGWRIPREAYNDALTLVAEKYDADPGRDPLPEGFDDPRGRAEIVECEPPDTPDRPALDPEARWRAFQTDRYDSYLDGDGPMIAADPAGTGKSTNFPLAAANRGRAHTVLFQNHRKAREFILDDETPDGYTHLKGGEQKLDDRCMDHDHADEDCPEHGSVRNCPHMCSLYDLPEDHETRALYEELCGELGPVEAHLLLDKLDLHDPDECPWMQQFDGLEHEDKLVGVHEYALLRTAVRDKDVMFDEKPGLLRSDRTFSVMDLVAAADLMRKLGNIGAGDGFAELARFTRDLIDLRADPDAPDDMAALDPPAIEWDTHREVKDPISGSYVETEHPADTLVKLKVEYNQTVVNRMQGDRWEGEPLCLDAVFAAAAEAGLDADAVKTAIAGPTLLDACPWCHGDLRGQDGVTVCAADDCEWREDEHRLLDDDAPPARARVETAETGDGVLYYSEIPRPCDLPDDPAILDATAEPEVVGLLFGAEPRVEGDDAVAANMRVTQLLDGQYHKSTLKQSDAVRDRVNTNLERVAHLHESVLVVGHKSLEPYFDLPANAEWLHYHAVRGLNRSEHDAVVTIGAPHPDVDDLQRDAELLATNRDDVRIGGDEHSTRRGAPNPPVYRKLDYRDENGRGVAVATKHYTGLVGRLFRQNREDELVQTVHRLRPVLADETKHVYMLTNVPTSLPIDEVATFDELTEPLRATLPVSHGAVRLLEAVADVAVGDEAPDGFRAETLVAADGETVAQKAGAYHRLATYQGLDVTEKTVRNWLDELEDVGLLDVGEYEFRAGRDYTADVDTLKSALQVLSSNGGFKVAAVRRLRSVLRQSDTPLGWLQWARRAFDLTGVRCDLDPPPG